MKSFQDQIILSFLILSHVLLRAALEDQQDDNKKSDRFGMSWFETDPWLSDPLPPSPVGPPSQRPQFARPPAPLDQARPPAPLDQARPPAPLEQGRPPAPLSRPPSPPGQNFPHHQGGLESVTRGGVYAEDIYCIRSSGVTLLSAVVIPPPEYASQPVFEDAVGPSHSPADCAMRPNEGGPPQLRSFAMHVQHFSKCGVRVQQGSDGKEWISVTLRFPYMEGLRMAEDEYVMIMCKPQDRVATTQHVMDIRPTSTEVRTSNRARPVFRSGPRDVSCRMSLMTRSQSGRTFNKEMKSGSVVRVGQEMQIVGQVREGDGWNYATLKDVVISRVSGKNRGQDSSSNHLDVLENAVYRDSRPEGARDVAQLVFADGCRNPMYRPVAPLHPQRDPQNPLAVSFTFRAFMFQDMLDGETLRVSAKVVACADIADCQTTFCDNQRNAGRIKREMAINSSGPHPVQNFTEDFQLTVTMGGFSKTPFVSDNPDIGPKSASIFADCKIILISVSSAALLVCLITTASAAIAIGSKRKGVVSPSRDDETKLKHKADCCKRKK